MGDVYLADDTELDRQVALKILPANIASDQQRLHRFLQEARAASKLSHPNVAHIYEIGEAGGTRFIAMEYVAGQSLEARNESTLRWWIFTGVRCWDISFVAKLRNTLAAPRSNDF